MEVKMPGADQLHRMNKFKFNSRFEESRRKRTEVTIQIRKLQKDDQILKRRNIVLEEVVEVNKTTKTETSTSSIDNIVTQLHSEDLDLVLQAMQSCRKILSRQSKPPIDLMIKKGVVPKCIECLSYNEKPKLQFEAAWALTNIASGTKEQTKVVIDAGAVPKLLDLLNSKYMDVIEQSVWALGNIAGDGPTAAKVIFSYNAVPKLVKLCDHNATLTLIKNVVWTLSNLCRCKEMDNLDDIKPALPLLRDLLTCNEKEVITDTCWSWCYLTNGSDEKIQICIDVDIVPALVKKLESNDPAVLTPVLRAIGNIVTGTDVQTNIVIANGALSHLEKLLDHQKPNLVKEAAWTISNITAGTKQQIQYVIDAGLLMPLINVIQRGDLKSSKEAAYAIRNITSGGSVEQIARIVQAGVVSPLCDLLSSPDVQVIIVVMETLTNIMHIAEQMGQLDIVAIAIEECGGLDKIEDLQSHENNQIYESAVAIIDRFFNIEDVDENVAPTANENGAGQIEFSSAKNIPKEGFNF